MAEEQSSQDNQSVVVAIKVPDAKPLEITFSTQASISDIKLTLGSIQSTVHYTSFALHSQGHALSDATILSDLLSSPSQKKLALDFKPIFYNEKSMNEHVIRTRDIVGITAFKTFGTNSGMSQLDMLDLEPISEKVKEKKEPIPDGKVAEIELPERTSEEKSKISQLVADFFEKLPQNYYVPTSVISPAVRGLCLSAWNPVPLSHKSKGHLAYIVAQTIEGETIHITGCTSGFFINKSSSSKFDPSLREGAIKHFTLYELLSKASKNFTNQLKTNSEKLNKVDSAVLADPQSTFLATPWITKAVNITADFGKTQFVDHSARDFNDEYQTIKELPTGTIQDRILREKLLAKTAYEFTKEATKGALSVLNGGITAMNPEEDSQSQIFLYNGIFYSFGVDAAGTYADKGGNAASRASSNQDVQAIKFVNTVGAKGIYTLMTTIVDFAGKRVICQTPVPGLFTSSEPKDVKSEETGNIEQVEGPPLTSVNYGSNETAGEIEADEDFVEALDDVRKALHFKKNDETKLVTNSEIKGMRGTDKRKYILDLFNSTPLDIEFIEKHFNPDSEGSYPHRQTVIRLEAVQDWWTTTAKALIVEEAEKQGIDLNAEVKEGESPPEITIDDDKILFSTDAFHREGTDDANIRELSKYIPSTLIPRLLDQYSQQGSIMPVDGANLTSQMHKYGINIRYLGEIANQLEKRIADALDAEEKILEKNKEHNKEFEEKSQARSDFVQAELQKKAEAEAKGEKYEFEIPTLDVEDITVETISASRQAKSIYSTTIQEMIARASKHILRSLSEGLPIALIPSLVSHFHNALLGTSFNESPVAVVEDAEFYSATDLAFTKLTPQSVRDAIEKDVKVCYRYTLPSDWVATLSSQQMQREIAGKFGIQWSLRDYFYTRESYNEYLAALQKDKKLKKKKASVVERSEVFEPSDVSFYPLIKHTIPRAVTAEQIFEAGRQNLTSEDDEKKQEGFQLISESLSIYEQVYGDVHPEVQRVYSSLSQIYQELGIKAQATFASRKAAFLAERLYGLDAHDTVVALLNLAYLELEGGSLENSLKIYSRLSQIWADTYEAKYAGLPTLFTTVVSSLQEQGYFTEAIPIAQKLMKYCSDIYGEKSYAFALLKFRLSFLYVLSSRHNEALKEVTSAYEILTVVASEKCHLTMQCRQLITQINRWKQVQEVQAKAQKLANADEYKEKDVKSKQKQVNMDVRSVEDILAFVEGNASKKGKASNGGKKKKGKK